MPKGVYERKDTHRERFMQSFRRCSETGCWLWTATLAPNGYGKIAVKRGDRWRMELANRVSYRIFKGEIPTGLFICHKCHTPRCVNPDHLYAGTVHDNARDDFERGMPAGREPLIPVDRMLEIRSEYGLGGITMGDLAEKHGASKSLIFNILKGKGSGRLVGQHIKDTDAAD